PGLAQHDQLAEVTGLAQVVRGAAAWTKEQWPRLPPPFDHIGRTLRSERAIGAYEEPLRQTRPVPLLDVSGSRVKPIVGEVFVFRPQTILLQRKIARLAFILIDCVQERR